MVRVYHHLKTAAAEDFAKARSPVGTEQNAQSATPFNDSMASHRGADPLMMVLLFCTEQKASPDTTPCSNPKVIHEGIGDNFTEAGSYGSSTRNIELNTASNYSNFTVDLSADGREQRPTYRTEMVVQIKGTNIFT